MRTVIVGNRALSRYLLKRALETDWNIVGVVVPTGQMASEQANFVSVDSLVDDTNVTLIRTTDINDESTLDALRDLSPDLCVSGGWSQILRQPVLDVPSHAFLGFHSSDLPRGRGGAPVNWSIIHGEDEVTISLFHYTTSVDAGDIVGKRSVPIERRDTVETVFDRLAVAAQSLLDELHENLDADVLSGRPQSVDSATYRPRRQPQDGLIDWDQTTEALFDWVRAQTKPYPGAYTFHEGNRLTVWGAQPLKPQSIDVDPGVILGVEDDEGINIATADGILRLRRVQPPGEPARWADEYAEDTSIEPGDSFSRKQAPESYCYTGIRDENGGTSFDTNLEVGEDAQLRVLCYTTGERDLSVTVTLDGTILAEEDITVSGERQLPVRYGSETSGTRTLKITVSEKNQVIDTRYLKVFVHSAR